jgi:hypothetical protein
VFNSEFLGTDPEPQERDWLALQGRTTLGAFTEDFLASLVFWDRLAYERHWFEAAATGPDWCSPHRFLFKRLSVPLAGLAGRPDPPGPAAPGIARDGAGLRPTVAV